MNDCWMPQFKISYFFGNLFNFIFLLKSASEIVYISFLSSHHKKLLCVHKKNFFKNFNTGLSYSRKYQNERYVFFDKNYPVRESIEK